MILVTGATGILGRVIVLELLKRGKTVRATKRKSSNLQEVRKSFQFYTETPNEYFDSIFNFIREEFKKNKYSKVVFLCESLKIFLLFNSLPSFSFFALKSDKRNGLC